MAKTPHTPGPWEAEGRTIYQVDQYGIAYCEGKRAEIDAKLMAASPEMKDVLVNILYEGSESVSMPEWAMGRPRQRPPQSGAWSGLAGS